MLDSKNGTPHTTWFLHYTQFTYPWKAHSTSSENALDLLNSLEFHFPDTVSHLHVLIYKLWVTHLIRHGCNYAQWCYQQAGGDRLWKSSRSLRFWIILKHFQNLFFMKTSKMTLGVIQSGDLIVCNGILYIKPKLDSQSTRHPSSLPAYSTVISGRVSVFPSSMEMKRQAVVVRGR